jgi:hypothetical protein
MEVVVAVFIFSLLTAGLSLFILKCMEEGMIFRRWYLFLTYHWIKWWRKKDRWKRKFLKVSGLCVYCYSTWVAIPFFFYFVSLNIPLLFLFIGLNYLWIEILLKITK